jgi:ATP-dependent Clp protease protease subunit
MRQRYETREGRFSNRVLQAFSGAKLPEALALRAAADGSPAEILLYDEVGFWGVTAKDFMLVLAQVGDSDLTLRINSPGGDVFDGLAIYNALKTRKGKVSVVIDGIAASIASIIAMAGTTITMQEQSMLMIHKAWGLVVGNEDDLLETAVVLGKIDGQMADIYATRSGQAAVDMLAVMKAETYYTSTEAKAAGLCDEIASASDLAARSSSMIVGSSMPAESGGDPVSDVVDDPVEVLGAVVESAQREAEAQALRTAEPALAARRRLLRIAEAEAA